MQCAFSGDRWVGIRSGMVLVAGTDGRGRAARVVVAGHVRLYCEGLVCLLADVSDVEVVGAGSSRLEILARVDEFEPDVVLLDPAIPDGLEVVRELALDRDVRVIALGFSENDP